MPRETAQPKDEKDKMEGACYVMVHRETKWVEWGETKNVEGIKFDSAKGTGLVPKWDLIASDFTEDQARRFCRMHARDKFLTPYQQAIEDRKRGHTHLKEMTDDEFEALYYTMSKEEFLAAEKPVIEKEKQEKAKAEAEKEYQAKLNNLECQGFKCLYLYGFGNSVALTETGPIKGVRKMLPGAQVDIMEGWYQLTKRSQYASIEDANPQLVKMGLKEGVRLYCYAHIEVPPDDPDNDFTVLECKAQGIKAAKPRKKDVDRAVDKTAEYIIKNGGYDMVCGFSCGGEVTSMLFKKLQYINERAERPTRIVGVFGTRCLYGKYGNPCEEAPIPPGTKAFVVHGHKDDEERPPWTQDNLWDVREFKAKWEAAGIDVCACVFVSAAPTIS
jgi:dienelactone hydrolase